MPAKTYIVDFASPIFMVSLSAWIITLDALLNAYMDRSFLAITGGKYFPEGWT